MAREHAQIRLDMWGDDDFRDLTPAAQHLYMVLLTEPSLTYAGVADWRPARIASKAKDWTPAEVNAAATELAEGLFIVVDESTEEVLVRSFIKHDGLMKNPRMAVSMMTAYAGVASKALRGVIVHEVAKLRANQPDLTSWTSKTSSDRLADMLRRESLDPADYPTGYPRVCRSVSPSVTPWVKGSVKGSITPKPTPKVKGSVKGSTSPAPAPAPAPSTSNEVLQETAPRERDATDNGIDILEAEPEPAPKNPQGTRLPDGWMPKQSTIDWAKAKHPHVDLASTHEVFTNYWLAKSGKDATKVDWDATWRNWIIRESKNATGGGRPRVLSFRERQQEEARQDFLEAVANGDPDPTDAFALIESATTPAAIERGA